MARQPRNLAEAREFVREERGKLSSAFSAVIGSRVLLAVLATFAIAFAANLIYSPGQLPAVGGLSLGALGLPPLDLGVVGEQAGKAADAASRQGAGARASAFLTEHAGSIPLINMIGLGLTLALLAVNLTIMTKRRRISRG